MRGGERVGEQRAAVEERELLGPVGIEAPPGPSGHHDRRYARQAPTSLYVYTGPADAARRGLCVERDVSRGLCGEERSTGSLLQCATNGRLAILNSVGASQTGAPCDRARSGLRQD